jgi:heme-degrading monooxygenase HmoA
MKRQPSPLQPSARIESGRDVFTLINTFAVRPERQRELAAELVGVTESTMRFLPGFVAASVHLARDGTHVVNYVQWKSEAHFRDMFADPGAKAHMERVSALALSVTPLFCDVLYVGHLSSDRDG